MLTFTNIHLKYFYKEKDLAKFYKCCKFTMSTTVKKVT